MATSNESKPLDLSSITPKQLMCIVRIQAVIRGILGRKLVRSKLTDVTLNSFAN